jgi:hypothetical protein
MPGIDRENEGAVSISATASASTTGRVNMQRYAGGGIFVSSLVTGVTITWHVAESATATPVALNDRTNTAVTQSLTDARAYPVPDECYGFPFAVPVLNAGTATIRYCVKG